MSFDLNKFVQAEIMELIDPTDPKNFRFTAKFENAAEYKSSTTGNSEETFRSIVMDFAMRSDIGFTDLEIEYAMDLYNGNNPWTKPSHGANHEHTAR